MCLYSCFVLSVKSVFLRVRFQVGDLQQGASICCHQLPDLRRRHMWSQRGRGHGPHRLPATQCIHRLFVCLNLSFLVGDEEDSASNKLWHLATSLALLRPWNGFWWSKASEWIGASVHLHGGRKLVMILTFYQCQHHSSTFLSANIRLSTFFRIVFKIYLGNIWNYSNTGKPSMRNLK